MRFNDDIIIMPLQAATQWDALSHVYYDDKLYNGFPANSVTSLGAFHCGIDKVDGKGITSRGVLLDIVRLRGVETFCELGDPITPAELDEAAMAQGVAIGKGDIVLIRTGWWARFLETGDGTEPGAGLDWTCASWLHDHEVAAVAADNLMVENPQSGIDGVFLPMHMLCLRDMGLMLGEYWDLTALAADCAADGVYEFQLDRAAAARDWRRRVAGESHCNQVGVKDDGNHNDGRHAARRRPRRHAEVQLFDRTGAALLPGIRRTARRADEVVQRRGPRPADVRATRVGADAEGARVGQRVA